MEVAQRPVIDTQLMAQPADRRMQRRGDFVLDLGVSERPELLPEDAELVDLALQAERLASPGKEAAAGEVAADQVHPLLDRRPNRHVEPVGLAERVTAL